MFIEQTVGNTPLIKLRRLNKTPSNMFLKLEGDNPAGSIKDRPAFNMIFSAQERGEIKPGDALVEATSGNTGIALAMVSAMLGYKMILIMPDNMSQERMLSMSAYGAKLIMVTEEQGMEYARTLAFQMYERGEAKILNQFSNMDNPLAHYKTTGPEIWQQTKGKITHFVSAMGTHGTITGVAMYLKEQNPDIKIIGVYPKEGAQIPGIRKWSKEFMPSFFKPELVNEIIEVGEEDARESTKNLAKYEGVFAGMSSGGAFYAAQITANKIVPQKAHIVTIACDRGDRYLSTGLFK